MQELNLLREKLSGLIRSFNALLAEKERLQQTIVRQEQVLEQQKNQIRQLEKQLEGQVMNRASETMDHDSRDLLRQQLDNVILQIEKNIELLK